MRGSGRGLLNGEVHARREEDAVAAARRKVALRDGVAARRFARRAAQRAGEDGGRICLVVNALPAAHGEPKEWVGITVNS